MVVYELHVGEFNESFDGLARPASVCRDALALRLRDLAAQTMQQPADFDAGLSTEVPRAEPIDIAPVNTELPVPEPRTAW